MIGIQDLTMGKFATNKRITPLTLPEIASVIERIERTERTESLRL